jgi:hypothetical protein
MQLLLPSQISQSDQTFSTLAHTSQQHQSFCREMQILAFDRAGMTEKTA